jgi:hypothetical protein
VCLKQRRKKKVIMQNLDGAFFWGVLSPVFVGVSMAVFKLLIVFLLGASVWLFSSFLLSLAFFVGRVSKAVFKLQTSLNS